MEYDDIDLKHAFLNRRDWGSYLSALQNAASYPKVCEALKLSRDWFTQGTSWLTHGASQASSWLVGGTKLQDKLSSG
ncbi:MAG TPA: hypothetical protein VKP66_16345 [Steroidobacteraceae bacterium]|nr:hypothetical protein [Steroidobacteraceae bacterium]